MVGILKWTQIIYRKISERVMLPIFFQDGSVLITVLISGLRRNFFCQRNSNLSHCFENVQMKFELCFIPRIIRNPQHWNLFVFLIFYEKIHIIFLVNNMFRMAWFLIAKPVSASCFNFIIEKFFFHLTGIFFCMIIDTPRGAVNFRIAVVSKLQFINDIQWNFVIIDFFRTEMIQQGFFHIWL